MLLKLESTVQLGISLKCVLIQGWGLKSGISNMLLGDAEAPHFMGLKADF